MKMVTFHLANLAFAPSFKRNLPTKKNTDDWYNGLDLGKLMGLVLIGLKKAFDTVDHKILCKKLKLYGVKQRELSWFESYLSNRKRFCKVNGVDSKIWDIEVGVPQGSCLGPLLFLIYINDLPLAVQDSSVSMCADDTSLCYQSRLNDLTRLNEAINTDLKNSFNTLRNTGTDLKLPMKRSLNGQRCFSHRGAKFWNGLSAKSKHLSNFLSFFLL